MAAANRIKHLIVFSVFLISFSVVSGQYNQQYEGSPCQDQYSGAYGTCRAIDSCQYVIDAIQTGVQTTICSFQRFLPIVCCPNNNNNNNGGFEQIRRRISEQKCAEYAKSVYALKNVDGQIQNVSQCGQGFQIAIVGGINANPNEFPHMAQLGYGQDNDISWNCGGTLISTRFVLTAAHCLVSRQLGNAKYVRLGDHDISTNSDNVEPQLFYISQMYRHPEYRPPGKYNDIALVQLRRPARLTASVRPACLYTANNVPQGSVIATGWGAVDFQAPTSPILLKVFLDTYTHNECYKHYGSDVSSRLLYYGIDEQTQLCAGSRNAKKDTCNGDSGGPIQTLHDEHECMYSIIGVTSFGKICGVINNPGVYTRVSAYIDWIEGIVWPQRSRYSF